MINLARRSYQKELMDRDDIPFADMAQTLKELNIVNTRLGGHSITLQGVKALRSSSRETSNEPLVVCEIGCGGGDNLYVIWKYCKRAGIPVRFIGIDMNRECIAFARQQYPELPCEWICSDYAKAEMPEKPDIIFSSLFCHHFTDDQLLYMLRWLKENSRTGFFINDLQRHWLAYYLIKYITRFFSKSYLVKNDACISVSRGFHRKEWLDLFRQSIGTENEQPSIKWKWAFRYLVTYKK